MKTRILIFIVCMALISGIALAHGDEQHIIGTISKISHDIITVQTIAKDSVEVMVTPETTFTKGDASAALKDLVIGDRVVIHAMPMKGGMLMAHSVEIGVPKAPPKALIWRAGWRCSAGDWYVTCITDPTASYAIIPK